MLPTTAPTDLHLPIIYIAEDDALETPLPLEQTSITGQINGPAATITVRQRYRNPLTEAAELEYLFPLSHTAAVSGFELACGTRRIQGDLQELKQAQERYEQARREGRRAGLLEQRRPNLFAVRIANLPPGEPIEASLTYQEKLAYRDGEYELVIPMGLTPKYHSPAHPGEGAGVDAPVAEDLTQVGPVELFLAVDAGTAAGDPSSPSHTLDATRLDERRFNLRLSGHVLPDHDFVLRYSVAKEQVALAAWRAAGAGGDYLLATLLPPALEFAGETPPREFVFVLDRSGSMSGEPIAQARNALRACLRALNPQDTFSILLFDDRLEWQHSQPTPVTQSEVEQADRFLEQVQGRGGTEIVQALLAALELPADPQRNRLVVFLTDGAVSGEARALETVRRKLGAARLFTFGIGPSVNRALLAGLARLGRGAAEFLGLDEDIEGAILRFQDRVSFPVITDLSLAWLGGTAWDVYPALLPDLYAGQPLEVAARWKPAAEAPGELTLHGKQQGQPVTLHLAIPAPVNEPSTPRLWARLRLEDLFDQQAAGSKAHDLRAEIIGLAIEHRLATSYTAFVAVDQDIAVPGGAARLVRVAQPLPKGLDPEGFGTGTPPMMAKMAMAAPPPPSTFGPMMDRLSKPSFRPAASGPVFSQLRDKDADAGSELYAEAAPDVFSDAQQAAPAGVEFDPEAVLRQLARTQDLNGSWGGDAEISAAALLAFARRGHTTRHGSYRRQVRRLFDWLAAAAAGGFAAFLRALAFAELARQDGSAELRQAALAARQSLPAAQTPAEQAAAARLADPAAAWLLPATIGTLDELRLAAVLGEGGERIAPALLRGSQSQLATALAASLS